MTFKECVLECVGCGERTKVLRWLHDPITPCACGGERVYDDLVLGAPGVVDDQIEGGPRFFETLGHEPVWIESKSQWRREVARRHLVNVVRHDDHWYAQRRKWHDEEKRDTGTNREY